MELRRLACCPSLLTLQPGLAGQVFGRNPIYLVSHLLYTILFIGTGYARNISTVIVLRFLSGAFGSTGSTMVGGTIADIWSSKDRGPPMGLFALGAIFGTGFGPFWAGFVAGNPALQWRWIQYIQAIYTGAGFIVLLLFLKETRGSVLLSRKAAKLRKETGDSRYQARADAERASIPILIKNSLTRPLWSECGCGESPITVTHALHPPLTQCSSPNQS